MNCKSCSKTLSTKRVELGFNHCVDCSETEAYGTIDIVYHKTGNTVEHVDKETASHVNKISRRSGFGSSLGKIKSGGTKEVLKQYLEKYKATTSKPSENVGDPNTVLTKSRLEELLSQHITDQKYIDDFIKKLGITGDGNYYIKAKNIDLNKTMLINVDQESRDAKVAPAKLQQMFNKL